MKIEINIDEDFLQQQGTRKSSFSKILDLKRSEAAKLRGERKQRYPSFVLDNKILGYSFAQECGLNTPQISHVGRKLDNIEFKSGTVLKPLYASSSLGVFIFYSDKKILSLRDRVLYTSFDDVRIAAKKLIQNKQLKVDQWLVEELLLQEGKIARDVKFYCFYGQVGLILESERENSLRRCWYDADLNYVNTGKYDQRLFKGIRNDDLYSLKKLAEKASLDIPSPFVRIDFMVANNNYYFGEYTPAPGSYDGFNLYWDSKLGDLYVEAATRLIFDIGCGKEFNHYNNLPKSIDSFIEKGSL